jgi:hypothetical protein
VSAKNGRRSGGCEETFHHCRASRGPQQHDVSRTFQPSNYHKSIKSTSTSPDGNRGVGWLSCESRFLWERLLSEWSTVLFGLWEGNGFANALPSLCFKRTNVLGLRRLLHQGSGWDACLSSTSLARQLCWTWRLDFNQCITVWEHHKGQAKLDHGKAWRDKDLLQTFKCVSGNKVDIGETKSQMKFWNRLMAVLVDIRDKIFTIQHAHKLKQFGSNYFPPSIVDINDFFKLKNIAKL